MNSKFCGRCGRVNVEQSNFCLECGLDLRSVNQPAGGLIASNFSPNLQSPTAPPIAVQSSFQPPSANNYPPFNPAGSGGPPFQQNLNPPPGNFVAPNSEFQQPNAQALPPLQTGAPEQRSVGKKLLSVLGAIFFAGLFLLKGGLTVFRLSHLGGLGLVIAVGLIIVVVGVKLLLKRG